MNFIVYASFVFIGCKGVLHELIHIYNDSMLRKILKTDEQWQSSIILWIKMLPILRRGTMLVLIAIV